MITCMTKLLQLVDCPLLCNLSVHLGQLGVKNLRKGFHGISIIYDPVAIINITIPGYRMYCEVTYRLVVSMHNMVTTELTVQCI